MARKYHNHTLQTIPLHHEDEMQSTNSHMALKGNFKQPALSSSARWLQN